jgi:hypothetical protein
MRIMLLAAISLLSLPAALANAQSAAPVAPAESAKLAEDLAGVLENQYVYPEVGVRYATMLRTNAAKGAYAAITDPDALGARLTADLLAVSDDRHVRVSPSETFVAPRLRAVDTPASTAASGPPGMEEARMIGDVAYLRFNQFVGDEAAVKAPRDFLLAHADAKAVIIDARPHRGGGVEVMAAMLPLLYAQKATLVRMDARESAPEVLPASMEHILVVRPSPKTVVRHDHVVTPDVTEKRLQSVPVYYLTSRRSASAAEHLALGFKRTGRAVLVGETTRGANHFGDIQTFGRFKAFIPIGRTYDPQTGKDWEGTGIDPDVAVHADQALAEALKLARAKGANPG